MYRHRLYMVEPFGVHHLEPVISSLLSLCCYKMLLRVKCQIKKAKARKHTFVKMVSML